MTISRKPLTLALSLKGRGNGVCVKYSPSPLAGERGGTWSIHSKCLDVNRLCLKMGRKSALKAAFAI
jgi:hypothetical protein